MRIMVVMMTVDLRRLLLPCLVPRQPLRPGYVATETADKLGVPLVKVLVLSWCRLDGTLRE